jgi:hypothetical protein
MDARPARGLSGRATVSTARSNDHEVDLGHFDEDEVRSVFDADPWMVHLVFRIKDVRAWTLWLDGRSR